MSADEPAVVHPVTGELLAGLHGQPPEVLSDVLLAIRERRSELYQMERALCDELRRRVTLRTGGMNRVVVFGDFEVTAHDKFEREWDADALEATMRELIDEHVLTAGEVTGLIRRKVEVSRSAAADLLRRLTGDAYERVRACFEWKRSPGKVEVVRSVELQPAEAEA